MVDGEVFIVDMRKKEVNRLDLVIEALDDKRWRQREDQERT